MSQTDSFLAPDFLKQYEGKLPERRGTLFLPVYLRTYSRYLPELKRRERWDETVARVVEYSMSLYQGPATREALIEEAQALFENIFELKLFPAGRTLWIGGSKASESFGEGNFNCSACVIDNLDAFGDMFQLLLCGCGTGFRVLPEDVAKLPKFCPKINVINEPYKTVYPGRKVDQTRDLHDMDVGTFSDQPEHLGVDIHVGDSREAWVKALRMFLETASTGLKGINEITFNINYNYIRPEGTRISTFGGRAPGPNGLMEMFTNLAKVITNARGRLSPVDCMDICNFIAKNVIVGGTRRSSQIALGSPDDQDFIDAKKRLWLDKQNLQRTMSNNSMIFENDPTREQIAEAFKGIKVNGEPGFINLKAMRKRQPLAAVVNPCSEIILSDKGFCNLVSLNLCAFIDNKGVNFGALYRAMNLATRVSLRATNITVSLPEWDKVQKRDRLLGVSLTGIMDAFDRLGIEFDSPEALEIFKGLREYANRTADTYAFEMRVPRPLLVTCIKPEGSLSQLPTVSSGIHRSWAPYFIRRVRVSSMDPCGKALQELGVPYEIDQAKSERLVFSFPISSGAKSSANEEPAVRQFERYLTTMKYYTDHNTSITITAGEKEWTELEQMVYDRFDEVVGCAFLPKYTDAYPQMPYEEITKEQYEEMMQTFPNLDGLVDLVNKYEQEEYEEQDLGSDCGPLGCPIR